MVQFSAFGIAFAVAKNVVLVPLRFADKLGFG
jgi:hypothetical protein